MIILTFFFIFYELIKIIIRRELWNIEIGGKKPRMRTFIELGYFSYLVLLLFTDYWYVGVVVFIISIITSLQKLDAVNDKQELTNNIEKFMIIDGLVTIIVLFTIVYCELII